MDINEDISYKISDVFYLVCPFCLNSWLFKCSQYTYRYCLKFRLSDIKILTLSFPTSNSHILQDSESRLTLLINYLAWKCWLCTLFHTHIQSISQSYWFYSQNMSLILPLEYKLSKRGSFVCLLLYTHNKYCWAKELSVAKKSLAIWCTH